jgi:hypothetical protein
MATQTTVEYPNAVEQMTKTWLATLDGIYKMQEQNEKLLVGMLEYNRQAREEGRRMTEKMLAQVGENQKQVAQLVETASKTMMEAFKIPTRG